MAAGPGRDFSKADRRRLNSRQVPGIPSPLPSPPPSAQPKGLHGGHRRSRACLARACVGGAAPRSRSTAQRPPALPGDRWVLAAPRPLVVWLRGWREGLTWPSGWMPCSRQKSCVGENDTGGSRGQVGGRSSRWSSVGHRPRRWQVHLAPASPPSRRWRPARQPGRCGLRSLRACGERLGRRGARASGGGPAAKAAAGAAATILSNGAPRRQPALSAAGAPARPHMVEN